MTTKLVRVARSPLQRTFVGAVRGGECMCVNPPYVDPVEVQESFHTLGEFFLIDERSIDTALKYFAETNPGKEIQVYDLVQVAQCPAAEMVVKKVSSDGVLPA